MSAFLYQPTQFKTKVNLVFKPDIRPRYFVLDFYIHT